MSEAYVKLNGWDKEELDNKVVIVTFLLITGIAAGAVFAGAIAHLGRRLGILIANLFIIVGVGM